MAFKEDSEQQTDPLATTEFFPYKKSVDLESGNKNNKNWSHPQFNYHPPPPKTSNKCFVHIFTIFVFLAILLLTFSLVVIKTKHPRIHLHSVTLTSLRFDPSIPSFYTAMSGYIRVDNPNFGPLNITSVGVSLVYGNSTNSASFVGGGEMSPNDIWRIGGRKRGDQVKGRIVAVEAVSDKAENLRSLAGGGGDANERDRLQSQLSSGVLELTWRVKVAGEVTLFGKIRRGAEGWTECLVSIDLRTGRVNKLLC